MDIDEMNEHERRLIINGSMAMVIDILRQLGREVLAERERLAHAHTTFLDSSRKENNYADRHREDSSGIRPDSDELG